MKIQCPCGTKYSFDITPEMARTPITFVCQKCGVDSSEMVNRIIRQQLDIGAQSASPPPPTTEPIVVRVNTPAAAPVPSPSSAGEPTPASRSVPLRVPIEKPP